MMPDLRRNSSNSMAGTQGAESSPQFDLPTVTRVGTVASSSGFEHSNSAPGDPGARSRQSLRRRQLLFHELTAKPGGAWAWNDPSNIREQGLPSSFIDKILEILDIPGVCLFERVCVTWRRLLQSPQSIGLWQHKTHLSIGFVRVERFKVALGLKSGQAFEQEAKDLTVRNWKRILKMYKTIKKLPYYKLEPHVTGFTDHEGPLLCLVTGGPYLFTGGADHKLIMFRNTALTMLTPDRVKNIKNLPKPSRIFGVGGMAHNGPITSLAASSDFVISGSLDGTAKLWKVESAPGSGANRVFEGHKGPVWCVALTGTKQDPLLVTGSPDKNLCLWEVYAAKGALPKHTMKGHRGAITAVCSVEKSEHVVSASEDKTIRIWSTVTGLSLSVMEGESSLVMSLISFRGMRDSKDYDIIISGSIDGTMRVWDREAAVEKMCVEAHEDAVKGLSL
mmetsp:Transcript_27560/g.43060  ORF Transcript_27560/g.43060 Transcript_27560/m.43060 type:complete len:448 (+) Transcript_27560:46-1389(+)